MEQEETWWTDMKGTAAQVLQWQYSKRKPVKIIETVKSDLPSLPDGGGEWKVKRKTGRTEVEVEAVTETTPV